jgi:hypothetical protein
MFISRSGNPIALTAILARRGTAVHATHHITDLEAFSLEATLYASCLVGMIHARNGAKPRMPRFGTEQMRYMRSRPWRPRGPWFDNRAGARRRGRRADELVPAVSDELDDGVAPVVAENVEAEDVLLASAPVWPILQGRPAALVTHDRANLLALDGLDHARAPQPIDQLANAVTTAHVLSSLNDDSVTSSANSRQSA